MGNLWMKASFLNCTFDWTVASGCCWLGSQPFQTISLTEVNGFGAVLKGESSHIVVAGILASFDLGKRNAKRGGSWLLWSVSSTALKNSGKRVRHWTQLSVVNIILPHDYINNLSSHFALCVPMWICNVFSSGILAECNCWKFIFICQSNAVRKEKNAQQHQTQALEMLKNNF